MTHLTIKKFLKILLTLQFTDTEECCALQMRIEECSSNRLFIIWKYNFFILKLMKSLAGSLVAVF